MSSSGLSVAVSLSSGWVLSVLGWGGLARLCLEGMCLHHLCGVHAVVCGW